MLKERNILSRAGYVVMCTNLLDQSITDEAARVGAKACLFKTTFSAKVLLDTVKDALEGHHVNSSPTS